MMQPELEKQSKMRLTLVGTFQLAMFELRQVVLVEAKNRKLMAKISELGPVTEKLRMKFRDVKEGRAQGRPYGQPESELQQEERKQSRLVRQQTRALTATREGFHLSLARDEPVSYFWPQTMVGVQFVLIINRVLC
ncbi:unnamed protein product [Polarella glacialis]|uniref:Uncharacterized protein n=1 Tax=Polarella glacialis TaxID=89957 RepID=A0A813H672_POLGL|nr:unnamed protein product [Polarella glacialis]